MDRGLVARGRSAGVAGGERETVSAPRPAPPACYASWLDYVIDPCLVPMVGEVMHARAELAELRRALADRSADLAICLDALESTKVELADVRAELDQAKSDLAVLTISGDMLASDTSLYRGNSVRHWYDKAVAYRDAFPKRDAALKELADTQAKLAKQAEMTVEAMRMRDEAQAERDALRMTRARGCQCGDADVCAVIHEMSIERDSLRAQVAELRGAILGLGELEGSDIPFEDEPGICVNLRWSTVSAWNEFVVKVRALPGAESKEAQQ